ncbi:MAG TPA: glycosyltransferase [Gaiellaceae bacterium]|nr:glycosyltransferase [Gaiellaceae bacterium]
MPVPRSIGLVGTYPPTRCGIATFTESLARALLANESACRVGVVACADPTDRVEHPPEVVATLLPGSPESRSRALAALSGFDVAVLQHEFGIYGGEDGVEVLPLLRGLAVPSVAVLHTVPRRPTARQQAILEEVVRLASATVVQSDAARARLLEQYAVDGGRVATIPHGATLNLTPVDAPRFAHAPVVLSWGLLGRDKGIEWGIRALAALSDLRPAPRYVIAGQTHPRVLETAGEEYRDSLRALAESLGVGERVQFENVYADTRALLARVRDADVVLLPYRSREQVVSGVLVEAIASGKPVVATRFPHAEELLGAGSGLLVPHEDAGAIADALRRLLGDRTLALRATAIARTQARGLAWDRVGARYYELAGLLAQGRRAPRRRAEEAPLPAPPFAHLLRLATTEGVFEHARGTEPRRELGYCLDDCARALVAVLREPSRTPQLERLAATCLRFLERAQRPDGGFRDRLSVDGVWDARAGSDDAAGRALWAAGTAAAAATGEAERARALRVLELGAGFSTPHPRAAAYALLGAVEVASGAGLELCARLVPVLGRVRPDPDWPWPEPRLAYANALLPEARIAAGAALGDEGLLASGLMLLEWLVAVELDGRHFSFAPVGGWARGERRPGFDQQPIEAGAMADACARAFDVTGEDVWAERALAAARWFLGANDGRVPLYDRESGGCRDGLTATGVNANEGAESTIALIAALQQARRLQAAASSASTSGRTSTEAAPTNRSAAPYVR